MNRLFTAILAHATLAVLLLMTASCAGFPISILDHGRMDIEVRPEKTEWLEGEEIKGTLILHNRTGRKLGIPEGSAGNPTALDARGYVPAAIPVGMGLCGGVFTGEDSPFPDGEDVTWYFSIPTDPAGAFGGFRMPPGEYSLKYEDPNDKIPAPYLGSGAGSLGAGAGGGGSCGLGAGSSDWGAGCGGVAIGAAGSAPGC